MSTLWAGAEPSLPIWTLHEVPALTQPHVAYDTPLLLLSPSCTRAVVPAKGSESPWKFLRKLKKTPWGGSRKDDLE